MKGTFSSTVLSDLSESNSKLFSVLLIVGWADGYRSYVFILDVKQELAAG